MGGKGIRGKVRDILFRERKNITILEVSQASSTSSDEDSVKVKTLG
jgi:hypothetical protein